MSRFRSFYLRNTPSTIVGACLINTGYLMYKFRDRSCREQLFVLYEDNTKVCVMGAFWPITLPMIGAFVVDDLINHEGENLNPFKQHKHD